MRKLYFSESNKTNPEYTRERMAKLLKLHRQHVRLFWKELQKQRKQNDNDGLNLAATFHSNRIALLQELHPTIYFQEY